MRSLFGLLRLTVNIRFILVCTLIFSGLAFLIYGSVFAQTESPLISLVRVTGVGATSTKISWITDRESDSLVNFGTSKNFGIAREPDPTATDHEVVLGDLEPSTTYYFRVVSSDPQGNQSFSETYTFTTKGTKPVEGIEEVKGEDQKEVVQKITSLLEKVKDEAAVEIISDKLQEVGSGVLEPPTILGVPDMDISADQVTVKWKTDKEANGIVEFAASGEYEQAGYIRKDGDASDYTTDHSVTLYGLKPQTTYHYQITSQGKVGPIGKSEDRTFTTKSILPELYGIRIQKVEEDSATLTWSTQVPAAGLVEYTNTQTKETKSVGNPALQISHTIRLADLKLKTQYRAIIKARTLAGDEIPSQPISFITVKDEAPPIISQVNNESTLYPGADAKVQTLVSWDTDELSTCQLFFTAGLAVNEGEASSLPEETGSLTKHVQVVTEFTPSTVYKFWIRCRDRSGNQSRSEDFVLFTPEKEKNIIDIILENFEGTFGWVKNIGK